MAQLLRSRGSQQRAREKVRCNEGREQRQRRWSGRERQAGTKWGEAKKGQGSGGGALLFSGLQQARAPQRRCWPHRRGEAPRYTRDPGNS